MSEKNGLFNKFAHDIGQVVLTIDLMEFEVLPTDLLLNPKVSRRQVPYTAQPPAAAYTNGRG